MQFHVSHCQYARSFLFESLGSPCPPSCAVKSARYCARAALRYDVGLNDVQEAPHKCTITCEGRDVPCPSHGMLNTGQNTATRKLKVAQLFLFPESCLFSSFFCPPLAYQYTRVDKQINHATTWKFIGRTLYQNYGYGLWCIFKQLMC